MGYSVLKWRKWLGNEIVMDAGCGSGLLTSQLTKQVPRGKFMLLILTPI